MAILLAWISLFCSFTATGQKSPMKWGEIPPEDLSMTNYPSDTAAVALVLGNYGDLEIDFSRGDLRYNYEQHRRIKILKQSGFDKGDVSISFYKKGEKISNLQVQVYTPDGKKYSLKSADIFEEAVNENWSRLRFSAPNLSEGAVMEYRYTLASQYAFQLPEWYFQEDIPTRWSEYRLAIPDWLRYVVLSQGVDANVLVTTEGRQRMLVPGYETQQTGIAGSTTIEKGYDQVEAEIKFYRYRMENVPAMRPEPFITTMDDYFARVRFQLAATAFPNRAITPVMGSWEKASKDLLEHEFFGYQFLKSRHFKRANDALQATLPATATKDEKVNAIYNFLNNTMHWNERYSYMATSNLEDCFEQKKGNSAELNLLFLALLKANDIQCHPLLLSTRDHGRPIDLYPIMDQFNHVAVLVEHGGQMVVADIASPHQALGFPRTESLNGRAWLVDATNPQWVDLPALSGSSIKLATLKLDENGQATGTVQYRISGYDAFPWREKIAAQKDQTSLMKGVLSKQYPDIAIEDVKTETPEDLAKPVTISFKCTLPEMAAANGDLLYLSPVINPLFTENPFKVEDRKFPVDIPYIFSDKFVLQLELPEGFVLEEAPEPIKASLPNNGGTFQYTLSQNGNKLNLVTEVKISQQRFEPDTYPGLRHFFNLLLEKQQNPVVLKRKK
ncbi:MAG: DUF3857 domain-containing protein [Saprospiraceae bacterium]|nr:DUF3857 domain-containing protein [Saprospiraceae bacterium]